MVDGARRPATSRPTSRSRRSRRCAPSSRSSEPPAPVRRPVQDPHVRRGARPRQAAPAASAAAPSACIPRPSTRPTTRSSGCRWSERLVDALRRPGLDHRGAPVFIQSFEQPTAAPEPDDAGQARPARRRGRRQRSTAAWTTRRRRAALRLDGVGRPGAHEPHVRLPRHNAGLDEIAAYADSIGAVEAVHRAHRRAPMRTATGMRTTSTATGRSTSATAASRARPRWSAAPTGAGWRSTRGRSATSRAGSPPTTAATRRRSTGCSLRSASTACSRTSRTPRWPRGTSSSGG